MSDPEFVTLDEVLALHADQIRRYRGATGLRDLALLQSAIAMPATSYSDEHVHANVFEMAAAYLFHLARNHPFVDGNERTASICALVFLGLNGQRLDAGPDLLYDLFDGVASGQIDKAEVAVFSSPAQPPPLSSACLHHGSQRSARLLIPDTERWPSGLRQRS